MQKRGEEKFYKVPEKFFSRLIRLTKKELRLKDLGV